MESLKYFMATTDELLQELITLQKEEMHRNLRDRRLRFYLVTLPTFIIIIGSVVSLWGLYEFSKIALENFSNSNTGDLLQYFQ